MFAKLGAKVLDADKIAHEVLNKREVARKIGKKFGKEILLKQKVEPKKLAAVVFDDSKKLKQLENIIHPQVEREFRKKLIYYRKNYPHGFVVLDVPLLFEAGWDRYADVAIVVKVRQDLQVKRAVFRLGISKNEALQRIHSQMPLKDKIRLADMIIDSSNNLKITRKQVKRIWQKLQQRKRK